MQTGFNKSHEVSLSCQVYLEFTSGEIHGQKKSQNVLLSSLLKGAKTVTPKLTEEGKPFTKVNPNIERVVYS